MLSSGLRMTFGLPSARLSPSSSSRGPRGVCRRLSPIDRLPYVTALFTVHGSPDETRKAVEAAVKDVNRQLASFEQIRKFKILERDFSPGGTIDITFKDQELQTAFAKQLGVPLFLANVTQQLYQAARAAGLNKEDGLSIIKVLEQLAGVTVEGRHG